MKTSSGNQRSILSFFGPPKTNREKGASDSKPRNAKLSITKEEESPIKSKTKQKKLAIESDSEDEVSEKNAKLKSSKEEESPIKLKTKRRSLAVESDSEDEVNEKKSKLKDTVEEDSPVKIKPKRRSNAIESDSEDEGVNDNEVLMKDEEKEKMNLSNKETSGKLDSEEPSSSTEAIKYGFSAETVPPLRKTARKQMKRSSASREDQQVEVVKKLKGNSSPEKKQVKDNKKTPKRTNCLDRFVFKKVQRNTNGDATAAEINKKASSEANNTKTEKELTSNGSHLEEEINEDEPMSEILSSPQKNLLRSPSSKSPKKSPKLEKKRKSSGSPPSKKKKLNSSLTDSPPKKSPKLEQDAHESKAEELNSNKKSEDDANKPDSSSSPESKKLNGKISSNLFSTAKNKSDKKMSYNPSKTSYNPIEDAYWKRNEDVPFSALSKTFEIIEDTSGRLKTIEILSNFLRSVIVLSPSDLLYCIYLCMNKVAPSFEDIELGVGEIYVCRVVAQVTGRSVNMIKNEISEKGDLGLVAEHSKTNQRMMFEPPPLTVKKVFKNLKEIALMSGQASQNKKIEKIKSMFVACKGPEARFLIRLCGGKLRIGLAEQSLLQAIAQACYLTPPNQDFPPEVLNAGKGHSSESLKTKVEEHANILKTTYCECPTFDSIVPVLLEKGMIELPNHCKLEPGIPLKPMLAHPTKGVSEVLKRFEKCKFTCEFKYDGERAQIHLKEDGTVSIFSRNQENNTSKYPDIISRLKDSLGPDVKSCVIDSEAVAYDIEEKKILPFQILSTRKRKDAAENEIKVQVCVFPFDLLYLNGRNLVTEPFQVRRDLLREHFVEKEGQFNFAKSMDSTNTEDIEEFLEESIKGNCEGLMVKSLDVDATYEIAKRSRNWLKLKKDYLEGVGDTIDVVVIGGFLGKGKRTGTYGGFLLACYDPDNEEFQSLCKIGTGFTDEDLQKHTSFLKEHVIENPKSYYRYDSSVSPDHWFDAVQVWEIKCADLSISPVHKAAIGIVDPEKGISLRFPRFLRIRDDKSPENATSASQIADLYQNQDQIKNQESTNVEEDFY